MGLGNDRCNHVLYLYGRRLFNLSGKLGYLETYTELEVILSFLNVFIIIIVPLEGLAGRRPFFKKESEYYLTLTLCFVLHSLFR